MAKMTDLPDYLEGKEPRESAYKQVATIVFNSLQKVKTKDDLYLWLAANEVSLNKILLKAMGK